MSDFEDENEDDGKPYRVIHGDCLPVMRALAIEPLTVDCIVTDPPYHLTSIVKRFGGKSAAPAAPGVFGRSSKGFMGKQWDGGDIAFQPDTWKYAMDLLPPGGHLLAFGGTRNFHRLACAIEDAGFEIRDTIMWIYGSGFPKSHDVSKGIDRAAGAKREVVGASKFANKGRRTDNAVYGKSTPSESEVITNPTTEAAKHFDGWGTALKPAYEPIIVARKPLEGTVAENTLTHGVGGINVDACRVGTNEKLSGSRNPSSNTGTIYGIDKGGTYNQNENGRWPANVAHDGSEEVETEFPSGESRFFYSAKAGAEDRAGSSHPTVKPLALMRWLVRMVCPPGGTVLDPFAGSGTTLQAAILEGFSAIGIEREAEYHADILRRLEGMQPAAPVREKWTAPADYDPAKLAAVRRKLGMAPLPTKTLTQEEKEARFNALLEGKI